MTGLRPDTIRPPAQIQKIDTGDTLTYRHNRSRRIFKARLVHMPTATYVITTRNGRRVRQVYGEVLAEDFTRVTPCGRCGKHHDVHRPRVHGRA